MSGHLAGEKWPLEKRMAFKEMSPAALVLVATDGPVSVTLWGPSGQKTMIGHNRAVWPAKWSKTSAWPDTVGANHDKSPLIPVATKFRVWCLTEQARDRLADEALQFMAARSERDGGVSPMRKDFADLGADLDLAIFEMEIHAIAERLQIMAFDDANLSRFLDKVVRRALEIRDSPKAPRDESRVIDLAVAKELGI
jgi:hypothetical protein